MAKTFKGIFGDLFSQRVHLRDSRHAAENFGYNKAYLGHGAPRHKFQFFVSFKFNNQADVKAHVETFLNRDDQFFITTMVKNVTMPNMNIETDVLHQYNKKKISQTRIKYDPITIAFHDTVEGKTLRLWEMYYEYYFRDGVAPEKLDPADNRKRNASEFENTPWSSNFLDNAGYHIQRVGNEKYLIDSISIYQVHGGKFSRVELVRPRISQFQHDTLDYSAGSELVEMRMTFEPEAVIYANVNEELNAEELDRYSRGDFWEMSNLITIRTNVPGRDIRTQAPFPKVTGGIADSSTENQGTASRTSDSLVGALVGRSLQRVEGTLDGIVQSIPNAIGSAVSTTIFGGTISFQPDPVKAVKTTVNQISRDVVGGGRRAVTAAVAGVVTAGAGAVVDGFRKGQQAPEEEGGEEEGGEGG